MQHSLEQLSPSEKRSDDLAKQVRRVIHEGHWPPGSKLPPTRALAKEFNVSLTTVNSALRVLHEQGLVECRPRRRGYVKAMPKHSNEFARQIVFVIPFVVPPKTDGVAKALEDNHDNMWAWRITRAAEMIFHQAGYQLTTLPYLFHHADPLSELLVQLDSLGDNLAGLCCFPNKSVYQLTNIMDTRDIPWMTFNAVDRSSIYNFVAADNVGGGLRVGRCLTGLDLHHVLMVCPEKHRSYSASHIGKISGLYQAYIESGRCTGELNVVRCDGPLEQSGYDAVLAYLDHADVPPQAIYATGDWMALGAIRACREHGLRVPEDVVAIGATGLEMMDHTHPTLTTLNQPMDQIGTQAAAMLLEMIRSGTRRVVGRRIPSPIIFRESLPVPDLLRAQLEEEYQQDVALFDTMKNSASAQKLPMQMTEQAVATN